MIAPPQFDTTRRWAFFLDVDGTLAAIAPTPQDAFVPAETLKVIANLFQLCDGALALVSGRSIESIDALFAPLVLPAAGLHGLERRHADGTVHRPASSPEVMDWLRPRLAGYARKRPGLLFEDKGQSVALHYRLAPGHGPAIRRLARCLARAAGDGIRLIDGKMVVEFQPAGIDKGRAIAAFLGEPPFQARCPIVAGDDTTDEDGFRVVQQLGGFAIKVGDLAGEGFTASAAQYRLPTVAALHRWLADAAVALQVADSLDGTATSDAALAEGLANLSGH